MTGKTDGKFKNKQIGLQSFCKKSRDKHARTFRIISPNMVSGEKVTAAMVLQLPPTTPAHLYHAVTANASPHERQKSPSFVSCLISHKEILISFL